MPLSDARGELAAEIRDRKSRQVSSQVFRSIQTGSQIEKILGEQARSEATPGVAAIVNGEPVTLAAVREIAV